MALQCAHGLLSRLLGSSTIASTAAPLLQAQRTLIVAEVRNGNINGAWSKLKRELDKDGALKLLKRRQRYERPSALKMSVQQKHYNQAVGKVIRERVEWTLKRRKLVSPSSPAEAGK